MSIVGKPGEPHVADGCGRVSGSAGRKDRAMTDEELMSHYCATQDPDAFTKLFEKFRGDTYRYVRRFCGAHDADDITQQVFISLWRFRERYREGCSVHTFIIKMAANYCRRLHRDARRQKRSVERTESLEKLTVRIDPADHRLRPKPDEVEGITHVISTLPEGEREMIECVFMQGMSYYEAADHLGMPRGTFSSRVSRLLGRLRELLSAKEAA